VVRIVISTKEGSTRKRWESAARDRALQPLLSVRLIETQAEHLLDALTKGTVSTNVHLRKLHNFALGMNWLAAPVIPTRQWPAVRYKERRGITLEEHQAILRREGNPERRLFYELLWHTGGSQSDIASLSASDVDRIQRVISYRRRKTGVPVLLRYGNEVADLMKKLPKSGPLFPYLRTVRSGDRATEFGQRCRGLGIKGVSLHSYRYAWAERARTSGYPERFAQEALGHNSKAVHRAYAKKAQVLVPSLEEFEKSVKDKVIPVPAVAAMG
jgi:integrase